ncbi:MAG TPA: recombinase family protein [Sphaerochaeta sp.]|nr:recombinase family protein [Sphaerochaeta sp.]
METLRLKELKVDVFFYNERIHLLSQAEELLLALQAGIAQAESANKSENIKWGLRRSTMDPDSPSFSRRCYGYDRNEEEGLILNIAEARIVLKIFDWYEQGWSIVRIKKELDSLKVPTPTGKKKWPVKTIENIFTNRLRQERWTDKDGGSRERILVVAEHVEFKKDQNTQAKTEQAQELDDLDQEIEF